MRAPQTVLQIKHERIRRHAVAPLEITATVFRVAPARAVHDDHLMRGQVAEAQPPIAIFRQDLTQGSDGVSVSV